MNDLYAQIQSAANAGATGLNGYAMPTPAQLQSGNYRKGRVRLYGLDIAIETPQGQPRLGKSDGKPWRVICMAHYGDISGTRGADGDPVDCYVGPSPESNRVFVVNQNGKDGAFDEHKVMLAFADEDAARAAYMGSYERGWTGLGSMVSATVDQFRWWLKFGDTTKPFSKNALPYDGDDDMTDITWDSAGMPANSDLATILYGLRLGDREDGLLLDAVQMSDILEDADGLDILDALVVENAKLGMKMEQLQRIMDATGETVKPISMQISEPFKQKGTTNVTALFELSDGQTVAIFFHNPDSTPNKILPQDELVSWKWLLNKKDVTILVAPEKGRDLNPREVARRIMRLAEKNSAKFQKANSARAERLAGIEQAKGAVAEKESTLASLDAEIADLTAKVEAKRANQAPDPAAPLGVSATELAAGAGSTETSGIGSSNEITQTDVLVALEPLGFERGASGGAFKHYGTLENGAARHTVSARKVGGAVTGDPVEILVATAANEVSQSTGRTVSAAPTIEERFTTIAEAVAAIEAFEARLSAKSVDNPASPGIFEIAAAMKATSGTGAWWSDPSIDHVLRKAAELGYVARPSTSQVQWTAAGIAALNMAKASYGEDGKGLPKAPVDQRAVAVKAELAKLGWQVTKSSLPAHLELYGARYEIRPSVDEKAQTVTWKDTGGGPEWIDDLSLSDQAMAEKIDSEYRASVEAARAAAREPELPTASVEELGAALAALGWSEEEPGVWYKGDYIADAGVDAVTVTVGTGGARDEVGIASLTGSAEGVAAKINELVPANATNAKPEDDRTPPTDEQLREAAAKGWRVMMTTGRRAKGVPLAVVTLPSNKGSDPESVELFKLWTEGEVMRADEVIHQWIEEHAYTPFDRSQLKMPSAAQVGAKGANKVGLKGFEGSSGWTNGHILDMGGTPPSIAKALDKVFGDNRSGMRMLAPESMERVLHMANGSTTQVEPTAFYQNDLNDAVVLENQQTGLAVLVNRHYFAYFDRVYKQPDYFAGDTESAVKVKKNGETVGLIMPIRGGVKSPAILRAATGGAAEPAVSLPAGEPEKQTVSEWESAVIAAIGDKLSISEGDATGMVTAQGFYMTQSWGKGMSAEETADKIIAVSTPAATPADDQSQAARELLQSVIDGTADLDEGLTERLEAVHDQFQGDAEIMALFEQAANAFSDAMVAKAKAALA